MPWAYWYVNYYSKCLKKFNRPPPIPSQAPTVGTPLPFPSVKPDKAGHFGFFFFVKHSFIKRTSAVYELPFVQITSVIQRYKIRVMHNSRLGSERRGALPFGLRI